MKMLLLVITACALTLGLRAEATLAFPGAQGFGALASGGRGGAAYHVTNLDDSGPGSFRDAVSKPGRMVVFDVGGVIRIKDKIRAEPNITIAGQSAPGDGITIYGNSVSVSSNTIIRYMRFHGSIDMPRGACTLVADDLENVIFDHVSVTWGRWDNLHLKNAKNVTYQYCIIGEGIDPQMFGALFERPQNITVHHCLWVDNQSRNPKGKAGIQYINNIVYNWKVSGFVGGHSEADHYQDIIGNYFIAGPNSKDAFIAMFTATDHVFQTGNFVDLNKDGVLNGREVTNDDFARASASVLPRASHAPSVRVPVEEARAAFERVIRVAGASLSRDVVDARLIAHVSSLGKTGAIIKSEADVGGQSALKGGPVALDSDGDGIPDAWERAHGLNPDDKSDGNKLTDSGFSNLEIYLNSLVSLN